MSVSSLNNNKYLENLKPIAYEMLCKMTVKQLMCIPQFGGTGKRARTLYSALHHNPNVTCFDDLVDKRNNTQIGPKRQWTVLSYLKEQYDDAQQNVEIEQNVPENNLSDEVQQLQLQLEIIRVELELEKLRATEREAEITLERDRIALETRREIRRQRQIDFTIGHSMGSSQH
jgi:hypothetical protein